MFIQANAKLNLTFRILGKLPNGYHQIKSIVQSIDLADFLEIKKARKTKLTGSYICPNSQNLILKAQKILEKEVGRKLPCQIHLQKVIPISAGLGGGSADAAATLIVLNKIYNLGFSRKKLAKLAIKIGADVPFFLYGGTCKVEGMGEKITPIKTKISNFCVIARPHKRIETKEMYEFYDKTGKSFLELCQEICPEVKKLFNYFKKFKLKEINISGSGPSVFCGVKNYQTVLKIVQGLRNFNGDIFICRPQNKAIIIQRRFRAN